LHQYQVTRGTHYLYMNMKYTVSLAHTARNAHTLRHSDRDLARRHCHSASPRMTTALAPSRRASMHLGMSLSRSHRTPPAQPSRPRRCRHHYQVQLPTPPSVGRDTMSAWCHIIRGYVADARRSVPGRHRRAVAADPWRAICCAPLRPPIPGPAKVSPTASPWMRQGHLPNLGLEGDVELSVKP
jgi:hypothetical protein